MDLAPVQRFARLQLQENRSMRTTSLVAALSAMVLIGCAKKDNYSADSARVADSANGAAAAPATPAPAADKLTDANIAALLDEANAGDSATGKIATTKGSKADVKAFGLLMM